MKLFKKVIAVTLIACMAFSFTACKDTSWVYNYEGTEITSGLYIANMMTAYAQAQNHKDIDPKKKDLFKQTIEKKEAKQWILDKTKEYNDTYVAIEKKFKELGLELSEKDNNKIDQKTKTDWERLSTVYEKNGVGEKTYRLMMTNTTKKELIFNKYYGKGGIEEVKDDNLLLHFKENFADVNIFAIPLETGDKLTDEQKQKNKDYETKAKEWVKLINEDKKSFNEVRDIFNKEFNEADKDKEEETAIQKDEETKTIIKKDNAYLSEKVLKAIFDNVKVDGDALDIPDEKAIYICKRYDVTKDKNNFDEMRDAILYDIKGERFEEMVEEWAKEISSKFTVNDSSIRKYKPQKINFDQK